MDEHRDLWWPSPTAARTRVVQLELDEPLRTVHGGELPEIQVAYQSWGTPNRARDNLVLIVHPLASDCHVTGLEPDDALGWWDPLVGPGRPLDTERLFIVCPNLIGGCYGTTGPRFPAADGEPHLDRFPLLTPLDMMRVQRRFLQQLGHHDVRLVIGPSMGGMIAWEWAIEGGDAVEQVAVVGAPLRTTAYQIGLNWLQRRGIELDLGGDPLAAQWGRMIARGVGMLSYRSGVGLEERFGREWFKPPGATLGDRGMYNIESWLRHHGKRILKRFDPYTYLLYSRAMDLHDVGAERGGLVAALDRIRSNVLVVGISTDQLYPAADVRLGADVLGHLGRRVRYAELRSPHGHDAFMLETEQLGAILRRFMQRSGTAVAAGAGAAAGGGAPTRAAAAAAAALTPRRPLRRVRLGILGAGNVAGLLLQLLEERREQLRGDFELEIEVGAVAEIDRRKPLAAAFAGVEVTYEPETLVARPDVDVVVDLTRGAGSRGLVEAALRRRRPVVTPNKGLIRRHGDALERLALQYGVRLAYHNAVAAAWPLLYAFERPLGPDRVRAVRALLSSTCNIILERIEQGASFAAALAEVRARGLTEPDPELDTSGWDSAQKLLLLVARLHGVRFSAAGLAVTGIAALDEELVRGAPALGYRIKLIGLYAGPAEHPVLGVLPAAVAAGGHLGAVQADNNAVVLERADGGELVYFGSGAGDLPVASAVLGDLIGLYRPRQSWTGRYPPAPQPAGTPRFGRHLVRVHGELRAVEGAGPGAVPLLDALQVEDGGEDDPG